MEIRLGVIDWTAIAACLTFLAISVSLYLSRAAERKILKDLMSKDIKSLDNLLTRLVMRHDQRLQYGAIQELYYDSWKFPKRVQNKIFSLCNNLTINDKGYFENIFPGKEEAIQDDLIEVIQILNKKLGRKKNDMLTPLSFDR